jgi:hypothetical protein
MKIKIMKECSEFIKLSEGKPLVKYLPSGGPDNQKIKVRKKQRESTFDKFFNGAFSTSHPNMRQRCVFASGNLVPSKYPPANQDLFYIFPTNGFKFMYSTNVRDSSVQYKETLESFMDIFGDEATDAFSEVLKYDYANNYLLGGIDSGCEIIIYSIPHYYAIRKSSIKSYSTLFSL